MRLLLEVIFWLSAFIIFWAMIGYPLSLLIINKVFSFKNVEKDYKQTPTVTVMVVAHNEEKVILKKLENIIKLNYPTNKIEFLIASDNSTDKTNQIVEKFIKNNSKYNIRLYTAKYRMGKTNAQNEAQKTVNSEILIMTDSNAMLDRNAVKELVSSFSSDDISYVTGKLEYINKEKNEISSSESDYWNLDSTMRDIESRIQTITAGNGALYACRNERYFDFKPMQSHDGAMPIFYALRNERAVMNPEAKVFEKAGETQQDEFQRKIRMNRNILTSIFKDIRIFNIFEYRWFSYFYFGHRTCRYLLWISHFLLLITNIGIVSQSFIYAITLICQIIFWVLAFVKQHFNINNKLINLINYYAMTVFAQWIGVYNKITGKSKPFWEKAESTR